MRIKSPIPKRSGMGLFWSIGSKTFLSGIRATTPHEQPIGLQVGEFSKISTRWRQTFQ